MPPPKNTLVGVRKGAPFDVGDARGDVVVDQVGAVGPGGEVAVVAA